MSENESTSIKSILADAKLALAAGDNARALEKYEIVASLGSKEAFLALGCIFERGGGGVNQDLSAARHWFERAWREGKLVYAARILARIHYEGRGVPVNYQKSYSYLAPLEDTKVAVALYRLGIMFEQGKGVTKDLAHARKLYRRSAKYKNIFARKQLGVLEVKRGNILIGLPLWISAIIQGVVISMVKEYDSRLLTW